MEDLSLHILDLAENSISAGAGSIEIAIRENQELDLLEIQIRDNGSGMSEETLKKSTSPFYTTRTTRRVGLGLSLFEQAARRANGTFRIQSEPGCGTTVRARFEQSHIDRQPLGDVASTLLTLIISHPDIRFEFVHERNGAVLASMGTYDVAVRLGEVPLSSREGIAAVRSYLEEATQALKR